MFVVIVALIMGILSVSFIITGIEELIRYKHLANSIISFCLAAVCIFVPFALMSSYVFTLNHM
jgi:hypothetical protein